MPVEPLGPTPLLWTASQRRAIVVLLCVFAVVMAIRSATNRQYLPQGRDAIAPRAGELADRLDPNTASWEQLAAIPTLGKNRAKAIVEFRAKRSSGSGSAVVFRSPADLTHVRGIGPAVASNIREYLLFPAPASSAPIR